MDGWIYICSPSVADVTALAAEDPIVPRRRSFTLVVLLFALFQARATLVFLIARQLKRDAGVIGRFLRRTNVLHLLLCAVSFSLFLSLSLFLSVSVSFLSRCFDSSIYPLYLSAMLNRRFLISSLTLRHGTARVARVACFACRIVLHLVIAAHDSRIHREAACSRVHLRSRALVRCLERERDERRKSSGRKRRRRRRRYTPSRSVCTWVPGGSRCSSSRR